MGMTINEERVEPVDRLLSQTLCECHVCDKSEIHCDLTACEDCGELTCPECATEMETEDGDPVGIVCVCCLDKADESANT